MISIDDQPSDIIMMSSGRGIARSREGSLGRRICMQTVRDLNREHRFVISGPTCCTFAASTRAHPNRRSGLMAGKKSNHAKTVPSQTTGVLYIYYRWRYHARIHRRLLEIPPVCPSRDFPDRRTTKTVYRTEVARGHSVRTC